MKREEKSVKSDWGWRNSDPIIKITDLAKGDQTVALFLLDSEK